MWGGCTAAETNLLQRLQNFAARTVLHQHRDSSASAAREELQLLTLASCHKFPLAFRAIRGSHPLYLRKLFMECQASHGHKTRHTAQGSIHLPLLKSNFGKKAFSYCVQQSGQLCQMRPISQILDSRNSQLIRAAYAGSMHSVCPLHNWTTSLPMQIL